MSQYEFIVRRTMHIKLLVDTHTNLKVMCARLNITMQSLIEELATLAADGDPYINSKLEELSVRKRERDLSALYNSDADTLFKVIEEHKKKDK